MFHYDQQIPAIETKYKGLIFRSRLEARWAAFFDAVGWAWQYEPMDLGKWSPDFVLCGAKHKTLIEVKPINQSEKWLVNKMTDACPSTLGFELLILGEGLIERHRRIWSLALGWLIERKPKSCDDDKPNWNKEICTEAYFSNTIDNIGFANTDADLITGENSPTFDLWKEEENLSYWQQTSAAKTDEYIRDRWATACNEVRFTYKR